MVYSIELGAEFRTSNGLWVSVLFDGTRLLGWLEENRSREQLSRRPRGRKAAKSDDGWGQASAACSSKLPLFLQVKTRHTVHHHRQSPHKYGGEKRVSPIRNVTHTSRHGGRVELMPRPRDSVDWALDVQAHTGEMETSRQVHYSVEWRCSAIVNGGSSCASCASINIAIAPSYGA